MRRFGLADLGEMSDDGQLDANEAMEQAAAAMLVELQRVEAALRTLRTEV